ncbi:MAG: hypothetical protein ACOCTQ_03685 [Planctomycetota bacterium]
MAERACEGFYRREIEKGFELILKLSDFMKNSLEFYPDSPDRWRGRRVKQWEQKKCELVTKKRPNFL